MSHRDYGETRDRVDDTQSRGDRASSNDRTYRRESGAGWSGDEGSGARKEALTDREREERWPVG